MPLLAAEQLAAAARRLCRTVSKLHALGWAPGTGGNFSVTLSREPLRLLITQSGRDKGRLDPARDLVVVGPDGRPADGGEGRPSAETLLHCTIAGVAGAGATLHTHSVAATLLGEHFLAKGGFTLTGYEMLKGLGVETHEARIWVPVLDNSQDMVGLSGEVRSLLEAGPAAPGFLLAGHGLYAWGADLDEARRHVEVFEFLLESASRRTRFEPFLG